MLKPLSFFALLGVLFIAPAQAGDVFSGKEIYQKHCEGCHGITGQGDNALMPNFARGDKLMMDSDRDLFRSIQNGKGVMPGFEGILKDEEIDNVITYLRTFL